MAEEFTPEDFISMMYYAKAFIGNSSAACKEASILGTPVVLTGRRQDGRVYGHNVITADHNIRDIREVTEYQMTHKRYPPDKIYYKKNTEEKICSILKKYV